MPSERNHLCKLLLASLLIATTYSVLCPTGKYAAGTSCLACNQTCTSCTSYTNCNACKPGYFQNTGQCLTCSAGCSECSSTTTCITCSSGYFMTGTSCTACASGCATCTGTLPTDCQACSLGYTMDSNKNCNFDPAGSIGVSTGALVGIIIGGIILCILIVAVICWIKRRKVAAVTPAPLGGPNGETSLVMGTQNQPQFNPYSGGFQGTTGVPPTYNQPGIYQQAQPQTQAGYGNPYSNTYQPPPGIYQEGGSSTMRFK